MKTNNYFTIDPSISLAENMKNLVNPIFQKEISLDILRGKPPDYSNLRIYGIEFGFKDSSGKYEAHDSSLIRYLQLSFTLHKHKYSYKKRSIKIIEQKINIKYPKKVFENFKALKETDESNYLMIQEKQREANERLTKVKERNNIEYPGENLYINDTGVFNLTFNRITEDEVDLLMSYWNKVKK